MGTPTTNYNLIKDDPNENYDIAKLNVNLDKIDTQMKATDTIATGNKTLIGTITGLLTTAKNNLVAAINEIFNDLATHKAESANKHIKESGSNANGSYIKFDDGTMICWHMITLNSLAVTTTAGSLFVASSTQIWTFPASFISIPSVSGTLKGFVGGLIVTYDIFTTQFNYRPINTTSVTQTVYPYLVAIGRWK